MTTVLVVSDLHCGSYAGLCTPQVVLSDSVRGTQLIHEASDDQKRLYDEWFKMCEATKGKVDVVIVNGDACDGMNMADGGRYTITNDMYAQARIAAELLAMIDCDTFILTVGSGYHSRNGKNGSAIEPYMADELRRLKGGKATVLFKPETLLEIDGKVLHILHHTGTTSSFQYRTTALMRDMTTMLLNHQEHKYGHVDMVIRGHAHYYIHVDMSDMQGIISPAWKLRDLFAVKINLPQPDIGYVLLNWDNAEDSITVTKHLSKLPGTACSKITIPIGNPKTQDGMMSLAMEQYINQPFESEGDGN